MRETVAGTRNLGSATAEAARSARNAYAGTRSTAYDLESSDEVSDDTMGDAPQSRSPRGRGTIDYAKADAQKAMKAKLIVGGIVGALLAVAILIGYVHRDRILASFGIGSPVTRVAAPAKSEAPRSSDRISPAPQAKSSSPSQSGANVPAAAVAQRSVLYEENPGTTEQQLQTFVGTAVWRTETVNPGPSRPPELGLRVEVEVPDRKMTVIISIRRNPDQTLPASHTIEVQFQTPSTTPARSSSAGAPRPMPASRSSRRRPLPTTAAPAPATARCSRSRSTATTFGPGSTRCSSGSRAASCERASRSA
jgi:hypothetical protein